MQDLFITNIHIGKVRHLANIDIALSDDARRHLILTGKNGSGKTSLLQAMRDSVLLEQRDSVARKRGTAGTAYGEMLPYLFGADIGAIGAPNIEVFYSQSGAALCDSMFIFLPAERGRQSMPRAIEPMDIQGKTVITRNASKDFLKYLLSLDYQLYGAKTEKNTKLEASIAGWFDNFESALRDIYDCRELQLQRDTRNFAFRIAMPGREPFGLHEMADGYKAFIDILMELLMRMENAGGAVNYEQPAIALIDELETHLHIELQKRALPFLTKMFPKTQFIVATHSPFVISSIDDAVVFDLEKAAQLRALGEDVVGARLDSSDSPLSSYSYEDIVEGYYDISGYSETFEREFGRYKELCLKGALSGAEKTERAKLKAKLSLIPASAKALAYRIAQFEREGNVNG
jgi:predicted ATPase